MSLQSIVEKLPVGEAKYVARIPVPGGWRYFYSREEHAAYLKKKKQKHKQKMAKTRVGSAAAFSEDLSTRRAIHESAKLPSTPDDIWELCEAQGTLTEADERKQAEDQAAKAHRRFMEFIGNLSAGKRWTHRAVGSAEDTYVKAMEAIAKSHPEVVKKYADQLPKGYGFTVDPLRSAKARLQKAARGAK
jgi:hypothetical protein